MPEELEPVAPASKRKPHRFLKGNKFGNRFLPGQSGNPSGRAKDYLSQELRKQLPELAPQLIKNLLKRAAKKSADLQLTWDRAEGPLIKNEVNADAQIQVIILGAESLPPQEINASTTDTR